MALGRAEGDVEKSLVGLDDGCGVIVGLKETDGAADAGASVSRSFLANVKSNPTASSNAANTRPLIPTQCCL